MSKPTVVVVGGGIAGSIIARDRELQRLANVVLIDDKDYFEVSFAAPRGPFDAAFAERMSWKHADYLGATKLVVGRAASVDAANSTVVLEDGTAVAYTHLVLATGSSYAATGKNASATRPERLKWLSALGAKIAAAQSICVIGSGPAGIEVLGEILENYPTKTYTLVSSSPGLLPTSGSPAAGEIAADYLTSKKVRILYSDRLEVGTKDIISAGRFTSRRGAVIEADLIIPCTGQVPVTGYVPTEWRDAKSSLITVDATLRVPGQATVYCVGDCNNAPVEKTAMKAKEQVELTIANLKKQIRNPSGGRLGEYGPIKGSKGMNVLLVSMGKAHSVGACWPGMCWGMNTCGPTSMIGSMKSGDLFVGRMADEFKPFLKK